MPLLNKMQEAKMNYDAALREVLKEATTEEAVNALVDNITEITDVLVMSEDMASNTSTAAVLRRQDAIDKLGVVLQNKDFV